LMITACGGAPSTGSTSSTAVSGAGESSTAMPALEPTSATGASDVTGTSGPATGATEGLPATGATTTAPGTSGTTTSDSMMTEGNAVEALIADPQFSTLTGLLSSTGLDEQLAAAGPVTIFAPTDEAFAALPQGTLSALSQDPSMLMQILRYHVAEGAVRTTDITAAESVPTLEGETLTLSISGSTIRVNDVAEVIESDISAGSSVIHAIDQVLLPSTVNLPAAGS
jgi:uncharacterized surface protein with fasciclin (FAS1) repeats